jgi:thioredoxin 1
MLSKRVTIRGRATAGVGCVCDGLEGGEKARWFDAGRRVRRLFGSGLAAAMFAGTGLYAQAPQIYPASAEAPAEIQAALAKAGHQHKRVILDFGGNWCGDCRALDTYFHRSPNSSLLSSHYILVDVNIGRMDQNLDIAKKYGVPLERGVPALAVLDSRGHVLYSQKNGEFEAMRTMDPSSVTKFLELWKGTGGE